MTIAKRLLALIGLAVAGIIVIAALSQAQIEHVYTAANYGNDNSVPSLIALDKVGKYFAEQRLRGYRHILADDDVKMKQHETKLLDARRELAAELKDYGSLVSDDHEQKLLDQVRTLSEQYNKVQDEMLDLSRHGEKQKAEDFADDKMFAVGDNLNKAIAEQITYNESLGKKGSDEALATKQQARVWAIVITLAITVAAVLVGLYIARSITQPLGEIVQVAGQVADGNLAVTVIAASASDEVGQLKQSIKSMVEQLRMTIGEINHESDEISSYAASLSSAAQQVSSSTERQAQSTASAAAAVEELTVSIDHVGTSADDASLRATDADKMAVTGHTELSVATQKIADVAARVEGSSQQINALSEQVQQIGNITTVIRDVADQTNLLALNAAIEAARAGEQGRGFAVVADEVRKLAERTTQSVQEITTMIAAIQQGATDAVTSMRSSREVVNEIVLMASTTSKTMGDIRTSTEVVQQSIGAISDALREQRSASTELATNVEVIAQMSEENSTAVESVADSAEHLLSVADKLKASIHRFSL